MNILVTGGAGFIASQITDKYIELGHNVIIADNMSTGRKEYLNPKAKVYELDVRDSNISKIFEENKIDVINHHAAQIELRRSVENPSFDVNVNVLGSINMLQNAVKYKIKKFIFASTGGAIYGEHDYFPADEEHPIRPYAPYGINKFTVEKYLFYYNHEFDLNYTVLRYANVYGPRQNAHGESGVVAIFTEKLMNGILPVINGDGEQTRDYVYVDDVVSANVLALVTKNPVTFNIATSEETTVNYIFHRINELAGTGFEEKHGPAKKGEQRRSVLSYEKIKKELGWEPRVKMDKGLENTINYFKINKY